MHSDAENSNARLASLLAGGETDAIALAGLDHLEAFAPVRFDAPPSWLFGAIEQARHHARAGNVRAARDTFANITGSPDQRIELGKYREHVTWAESENARKLSALAWTWTLLQRCARQSIELDRKLERLERFASEHYGVTELRTERGWAEGVTRQGELLPPVWRAA